VWRQPPAGILRQDQPTPPHVGNRQANAAIYRIALSRLRWDTRTRDYLARRTTEGKTRRETIRCLIGGLSGVRLADRVVISSVVPGDGLAAVPRRWPV
jgi:hypothetical protein